MRCLRLGATPNVGYLSAQHIAGWQWAPIFYSLQGTDYFPPPHFYTAGGSIVDAQISGEWGVSNYDCQQSAGFSRRLC